MSVGSLLNKHILLGVTGGIAAYKAAELVRLLRAEGAEVRVVMTQAATEFIAPMTFQALSGNPVRLDLFDEAEEAAMGHINLARWADLIVLSPASADFIAKMRIGVASDLLSTLCLATQARIFIAPAMNRVMWEHPATQENILCLSDRGVVLMGPGQGGQACGETGWGRMLEPQDICRALTERFETGVLKGVSVLITAGPTREAIDPVRFISNRSSGKMGFAIAEQASAKGARVTLVSGPAALAAPAVAELVEVESASEMYSAVMQRMGEFDIFIGTAAVADYSPVCVEPKKIKKQADETSLNLKKNRDILAAVAQQENTAFTVGFAAETENLEDHARAKLKGKDIDMIAANRVGKGEGGFESKNNALLVLWRSGRTELSMAPKPVIAGQLLEIIAQRYHAKNPA